MAPGHATLRWFLFLALVPALPHAATLCEPQEKVVFTCDAGRKTLSICSSATLTQQAGYIQYRFGVYGQPPELVHPQRAAPPASAFTYLDTTSGSGQEALLAFSKGSYTYTVVDRAASASASSAGRTGSGVVVAKSGSVISDIQCDAATVQGRLDSLRHLGLPPARALLQAQASPPPNPLPTPQPSPPSGPPRAEAPAPRSIQPAQALDGIRQCDERAAHPDDPEAVTRGTADDKLDPNSVIAACEAAIRAEPQTPRLRFQLARGYLKADRFEDAIEQLIPAAQQGHGGALAYLGDIHLDGAPGIEADPGLARKLYEKALASGFEPARKILAEFEDMTEVHARAEAEEQAGASAPASRNSGGLKPYSWPNVIENIQNRKFDQITKDELITKDYLIMIADNIRSVCESHFSWQAVDSLRKAAKADHYKISVEAAGHAVWAAVGRRFDPRSQRDPNAAEDELFQVSMKDTEALFQRHMCNTPGLEQFSKNLTAFVKNEDAPLPTPEAIEMACLTNPPPSSLPPRKFCPCFAAQLTTVHVTQKNRKDLVNNFKETSLEVMKNEVNQSEFKACRPGN